MSISELDTEAVRRRRTTPGMVADVLRDAIMRGVLRGGQPLRQDELAAQFGLSRIPVREALRQLEGEGLVTVNPHRGAVVSTLSSDELQEICEIRGALETMALRLAIPHLDEETLAHAEAILVETDRETDVLEHWSKNNWRFHSTLYLPAHRPRLLAMIKNLHDTIDRYLRLHVSILNYKAKGQEEHWQLLDACRRRDTAAAVALLEQHIQTVAVLLAAYLPQDHGSPPRTRPPEHAGHA
jgi:DNA-binding GntR family transcriptional regulator